METIFQNMMVIFGFGNEREFSRDEFHFFLDCLFRGLFKLLIVTLPDQVDKPPEPATSIWERERLKPAPLHPGKRLAPGEIDKLVSQVFPNNIEIMERSDFIELMQPSKEISEILTYVH
jgi:hypothetical protein